MQQPDEFMELLYHLAPGNPFREGLDTITRLGKGALILIADKEQADEVVQSGFALDTEFTPQKLSELSKMDRAIVVDRAFRRILYANAHLVPDADIPSGETGTRHLTAEKVARQIDAPTIAVSASKDRVTVYYGQDHYILPDLNTLIARVNQALRILEQYRSTLDDLLWELTALEFEGHVLFDDLASTIQLMVQMLQVKGDIERWFVELGEEKQLHQQMLEWLMLDVGVRFQLIVRDYQRNERPVDDLVGEIRDLPPDKLFESEEVLGVLGYEDLDENLDTTLSARGYRVLHEIPRLPSSVAERVVGTFGSLPQIAEAEEEELMRIKGIAVVRARAIRAGITRIKSMYNSITEMRHGR